MAKGSPQADRGQRSQGEPPRIALYHALRTNACCEARPLRIIVWVRVRVEGVGVWGFGFRVRVVGVGVRVRVQGVGVRIRVRGRVKD